MSKETTSAVNAGLSVGEIVLGIVGLASGDVFGVANIVSGATGLGVVALDAPSPAQEPAPPPKESER